MSSKYGNGTEATLCSTVVKAVQAYFKCKDGSAPGAVGLCGTKGVAEYKSASGPEVYHLAVYDPAGGAMLASIYNKDTEMLETLCRPQQWAGRRGDHDVDAPRPDGGR